MLRVRKNDIVQVLAGKDKGKTGKIITLFPTAGRALVQGINFVKKHQKRRSQQDQGGIVLQEATINLSNLNVVCKKCNKAARIGVDTLQDGSKIRFCKRCKEEL